MLITETVYEDGAARRLIDAAVRANRPGEVRFRGFDEPFRIRRLSEVDGVARLATE